MVFQRAGAAFADRPPAHGDAGLVHGVRIAGHQRMPPCQILALGDQWPRVGYRTGIWRFAADGSDSAPRGGVDLLARSELKPDAAMNSDVTLGEAPRLVPTADGRAVLFSAPIDGAYELWRVALDGGSEPERLTTGEHYISGWDAVPGPRRSDRVVANALSIRAGPRQAGW